MEHSLVSVIIPAYQVENYIETCVNSLLAQTYPEIEILISYTKGEDRTALLCKELATGHDNVFAYENTRFGVSYSRNNAMSHAKGVYYAFVDGDDWVEPEYIQRLVETMEGSQMGPDGRQAGANDREYKGRVELAMCGFRREGKAVKTELLLSQQEFLIFSQIDTLEQVICNNQIGGYLWNKMFLGDLIRNHQLTFDGSLCIGEDMVFITQYLHLITEARYTSRPLYHYRTNPESAMQKMYSTGQADFQKIDSNLRAAKEIERSWSAGTEMQSDSRIRRSLDYRIVRSSLWGLFNLLKCDCYDKETLKKLQKNVKGRWQNYRKSRYAKGVEKFVALLIRIAPCVNFVFLKNLFRILPKAAMSRYVNGGNL